MSSREIWGTVLIIIGIIYAILFITKPTWVYKTAKVKALIKMMGKNGFEILFFVFMVAFLAVGIYLVS